jgi:hypothetical protein
VRLNELQSWFIVQHLNRQSEIGDASQPTHAAGTWTRLPRASKATIRLARWLLVRIDGSTRPGTVGPVYLRAIRRCNWFRDDCPRI